MPIMNTLKFIKKSKEFHCSKILFPQNIGRFFHNKKRDAVLHLYNKRVESGQLRSDPNQLKAIQELNDIGIFCLSIVLRRVYIITYKKGNQAIGGHYNKSVSHNRWDTWTSSQSSSSSHSSAIQGTFQEFHISDY